jgi:uncharacterized protein
MAAPTKSELAKEGWERVKGSRNRAALEAFATEFNGTDYAKLSRVEKAFLNDQCQGPASKGTESTSALVHVRELIERRDFAGALTMLERAAGEGDHCAMEFTGAMYRWGVGVEQNNPKAVEWFRKAAAVGNRSAMYDMGVAYLTGTGVVEDGSEAMRWFRKAADAGSTDGMVVVGCLYDDGMISDGSSFYGRGGGSTYEEYVEAIRWFRKAAALGNTFAMFRIGSMYHSGTGVQQDNSEALRWYGESANLGDSWGMLGIGSLKQDDTEEMRWYRKAADLGNTFAMICIAGVYEPLTLLQPSLRKRFKRKASVEQSAIDMDCTKAMEWMRKASDAGNGLASYLIAGMYENGVCMNESLAEANSWYRKAAEAGLHQAKEDIQRLERQR